VVEAIALAGSPPPPKWCATDPRAPCVCPGMTRANALTTLAGLTTMGPCLRQMPPLSMSGVTALMPDVEAGGNYIVLSLSQYPPGCLSQRQVTL
jgi:hypothetical protein